MDEYPQPGLLPIIPRFAGHNGERGPSPFIPIIVLIIVGTLRWALLLYEEAWNSFETESFDWGSTFDAVQSHLTITALLIPICLLLAVQAFGMPQANQVGEDAPPPRSLFVDRNLWSSILLLVIIAALILSIPIRGILHGPWQRLEAVPPPWQWQQQQQEVLPPLPMYTNPGNRIVGRSHVVNGVCEELGILQRRCENWKGNSRDSVCRELAVLQKRCERSRF